MQTVQSHVSAPVAQAMETDIKHTSAARFSCEEPVVAETSTAAALQATCRQSAPIRRALHCIFDVDNLRLIGQRDVHRQLTAVTRITKTSYAGLKTFVHIAASAQYCELFTNVLRTGCERRANPIGTLIPFVSYMLRKAAWQMRPR